LCTVTTSGTGFMVGKPASTTWFSFAPGIITWSTKAAGR
jgi:hypothetical protein